MLEGLDKVDWGRLTHAYGRADDVPGWIRALTSADAEVRKRAFGGLHANICHQGSRYRASAPAVPFLFEVLEAPRAHDRVSLIQLLEGLAVGYPEWHIPLGFDPAACFAEAEELGRRVDLDRLRAAEPDDEDDWEPGRLALWQRDAYRAVLRRLGTFQGLTRDAEKAVRMEAVKALAWFPEAAAESARHVRSVVHGQPEPDELANAILCLGVLDRYLGDVSDVPRLVAEMAPERPLLARVSAAISLAVLLGESAPAGCLAVLLDAVQDPGRTGEEAMSVSWHWLGLVAHASAAIMLVRPGPTEPVLAALCRAAEEVRETMAGAEVFWALLSVAFPDPSGIERDPNTGFRRLDPARLTEVQRRALDAIGRSPVWEAEPFFYGRLMDVGLEYGLPWDPEKFRTLLDAVRRGAPGNSGA